MDTTIKNAIEDILKCNICASLSTISNDYCHSNTIYFCYDDSFNLYFASDCKTEHCVNISNNPNVALSIWNTPASYGIMHKGLQIKGKCRVLSNAELVKAWSLYIKRFPVFSSKIGNFENISKKILSMRIYKIEVSSVKLTDSEVFGNEIKEIIFNS